MDRSQRSVVLGCMLLVSSCGGSSCGGDRAAPTPPDQAPGATSPMATNAALGGDVVARIGNATIDRRLVTAVARARGLGAKAALDVLLEEAVLAEAAVRAGALGAPGMRLRLDAPVTRTILDRLRVEALAEGDWTDAELAQQTAEQWQQLDRPEGRTVVHALVKKDVPDAEQVAKRLHDVLATANGADAEASSKAFTEAARAFKLPDGKVPHVEELAFVADGRMLDGKGSILESFAKGTFAIPAAFGTSEVVQTSYGFHVIRLLAIFPPKVASREERVALLTPQLLAARVKKVHDAKVAALAKATPTQLLAVDQDLALPR